MSELDSLATVLRSNFCSDWDFKRNGKSITLMRDTGDHKETIRVLKDDCWYIIVKIMDRNMQMYTPTSYNAHHEKKLTQEHIRVADEVFNKLTNYITNLKPHTIDNFQSGVLIEKEKCNIGKPHNHFYVTQYTIRTVNNPRNIMQFIMSRYEFFKRV